ncbi:hypothetical protein DFH29DRAFT_446285 [Suillus ampliporus]|nr:hypothetical protein DFH29DRAFT_446285 [Suillus ampliporus]
MPHPSVATSSNAGVRLDWPIQESYRFPDAASAVEYSASEQGTPASPVARSEWTGFHHVANFDGCSEFSSPPPEPSAQSMHAGFVQDVLPLRRYENTAVAASTSVNHHTNQHFSTSATSRPLAKIVTAPQIASFSNPSPKDDSQLTLTHSPHSSHRMPSDSSLLQHSIAISRNRRASTPANPVSSLYPLDVVKDTSNSQSHLTSYPPHPATDAIGMSAGSDGFGHVNQYNQCAYPIDGTVAQAHGWRRSAQPQKYQSREGPRRGPQPPTIPSTALPPAPSSLVYDYADVDLRSTEHPPYGAPKRLRETLPEDGDAITSEHVCDSEHWQLVSRTTFGIETQLCDGTEGDAVASELVTPIADTPVNAGIVKDEVKVLPHPASLITSASQIAVDSGRGTDSYSSSGERSRTGAQFKKIRSQLPRPAKPQARGSLHRLFPAAEPW